MLSTTLSLAFALLSSLIACGTPQETFEEEFPAEICAWAESCASTDTGEGSSDPLEATCEEAAVATLTAFAGDDTCTYDAAQAAACLDAIAATACDDETTLADTCAAVYTGDTCNLTIGDYL